MKFSLAILAILPTLLLAAPAPDAAIEVKVSSGKPDLVTRAACFGEDANSCNEYCVSHGGCVGFTFCQKSECTTSYCCNDN